MSEMQRSASIALPVTEDEHQQPPPKQQQNVSYNRKSFAVPRDAVDKNADVKNPKRKSFAVLR